MITISDAELYRVFEREYPKDLGQLARTTDEQSPYDLEARSEAAKFAGKRWEEVGAKMLQECYDIPLLLNPQAFHYFFPAFIKQSQIDVEKTGLLVDALINLLAGGGIHWPESLNDVESELLKENPEIAEAIESTQEKGLSDWRQERWKLFTEQQWALVRKWLSCMDQDERLDVDRAVLRKAMQNAKKWQMKRASGSDGEHCGPI